MRRMEKSPNPDRESLLAPAPARHRSRSLEQRLLSLQASIGNAAVSRLLGARVAVQRAPTDAGVKTDAGVGLKTDAGTADAGVSGGGLIHAAGDLSSKAIVYLSWSFDDGPTAVTKEMEKVATIPGTWFVMRNEVGTGAKATSVLKDLKKKQDAGQEIGIHSMHPTGSHVAWFPATEGNYYPDIKTAMQDLEAFYKLLTGAGITIKFVRAPTGLFSEVTQYLKSLGIGDENYRELVARAIILGTPIPKRPTPADAGVKSPGDAGSKGAGSKDAGSADAGVMSDAAAFKQVSDDVDFMKKKLASLGVHEWGGVAGQDPAVQGWEGESEPKEAKKMTDNAIPKAKWAIDHSKPGAPRSVVILAHDTAVEPEPKGGPYNRVQKVAQDMKVIEAYAKSNAVRIEYVTMSDLYTKRVGSAP
jgi:polysaccharide deacetylase